MRNSGQSGERGRSRTPLNSFSLKGRRNRERERERSVSEDYERSYNKERERERSVSEDYERRSYNKERESERSVNEDYERRSYNKERERERSVNEDYERRSYNKERERERSVSEDYGRAKSRKRSESREIRNQEAIAELRSVVLDLADKLEQLHENRSRTRLPSRSPDPSISRNTKRSRDNLEPMSKDYKKAFRDDVIHILKSLDDSLNLDYKNRWTDIEIYVVQNTIPAIKRALGDRFDYTNTELKKILQNIHRHRRDAYTISLNPHKTKANKQRTGTNSRRKDKKERRQRGLQRMIDTNDKMLTDLQPSMEWDDWIKDLKGIIDESNYHSDEVSESDEDQAQEEKNNKIRPSRNEDTNHVLHVYDKEWRSQRLRLFLRHVDKIGEAAQNIKVVRKRWYNDQIYVDRSKPPLNAPKWTVSSSYQSE